MILLTLKKTYGIDEETAAGVLRAAIGDIDAATLVSMAAEGSDAPKRPLAAPAWGGNGGGTATAETGSGVADSAPGKR